MYVASSWLKMHLSYSFGFRCNSQYREKAWRIFFILVHPPVSWYVNRRLSSYPLYLYLPLRWLLKIIYFFHRTICTCTFLLSFLLLLFLLLLLINVAKHERVQKCPDPELRAAAPYDMSNSLLYTHITPTHELRLIWFGSYDFGVFHIITRFQHVLLRRPRYCPGEYGGVDHRRYRRGWQTPL